MNSGLVHWRGRQQQRLGGHRHPEPFRRGPVARGRPNGVIY